MINKVISLVTALVMIFTSVYWFFRTSLFDAMIIQPTFSTEDCMEGATILYESLRSTEIADASNIFTSDFRAWTPSYIAQPSVQGGEEGHNSVVEIQLKQTSTFNTAVILEEGNEVQYFRLQIWQNDEWVTIYKSEKIEGLRLCSFDAVTTDRVRLSIDEFRSEKTAARIRSLQLYNEPQREVDNFNVTVYQRLDGDKPSEVLKRSAEEIKTYARFYDVYNTVLVFGAVNWKDGEMVFNFKDGEEGFARELAALRELIAQRSNLSHNVNIVCTALADGAGGNGHTGVNEFMAEHWERVADQMVEFMKKYDLDGLDVDWEYPETKEDWRLYDKFIARLDDGMNQVNPNSILSAAISSWAKDMSKETLKRFDQIQFMAYDGHDDDGYQSSLDQAQRGLMGFKKIGADLKKVNIGIAAYGRPVVSAPVWIEWRRMQGEDLYWNNKHYNIDYNGKTYDAAFCSPALAGDKTAYALLSGAGGVMVFRLACDKTMDDPNSIACGIENTLNRYFIEY